MENFKETAKLIAEETFNCNVKNVSHIGGGFYGVVFLVELDKSPFKAVVKLYLVDGLNHKEAAQLKELSKHAVLEMPSVYKVINKSQHIDKDAIVMEFLKGSNAGIIFTLSGKKKKEVSNAVVDNLLSFHNTINEKGFGEIDATEFNPRWEDFYKKRSNTILEKAERSYKNSGISEYIYSTMKKAYEKFDLVFSDPVTQASLIHGDYNMWNILYDKYQKKITGCIDPFNSMWADSEFDLYQLSNANGKHLALLKTYCEKRTLSRNFEIKSSYYRLFTEINHYIDSNGLGSMKKYHSYANDMENQIAKLI